MGHIKLKPSKHFDIDFHPSELDNEIVPDESKKIAKQYMQSKTLTDDYDIMLMYEDKVIYGFDYLHSGTKKLIVELNPVTVFYSNSVMSFGSLNHYKNLLLANSSNVADIGKPGEKTNFTHSAMYFQLAINCIINLQATLESFANRIIPEDYHYLNKLGNPVKRTVTYKLNTVIPIIKEINFQQRKHRKYNISIDNLIQLRNDIIHLKPTQKTNTAYKLVYRDLLNFDYQKAILSVKTFINFYEPNLIEECACGNDYSFYSSMKPE